jgi:probable F420-dependent oxidoreductase
MKFGLRYANLGRHVDGPAAVELAQAAEAAGFDSIWTVEHVVVPNGYQSRYPYAASGRMGSGLEDFPIPDPLMWLAYIASATRSIKLGTAILILPQRNPVITAKAVATLDHMAGGGRVLLGIGVGWLAEEFATLGVPFEDRGARTDDYVAAMRALWSQELASHQGRFVSFKDVFCRCFLPIADTHRRGRRHEGGGPESRAVGDGYFPARAPPPISSTRCRSAAEAGRNPADIEITAAAPAEPSEIEALAAWRHAWRFRRAAAAARAGQDTDDVLRCGKNVIAKFH